MTQIIAELINNLQVIGICFGLFFCCVLANAAVKTYYNVFDLKHNFCIRKLFKGLCKMLVIGFATGLLCVVTTAIHYVPILEKLVDTPEGKALASNITIV